MRARLRKLRRGVSTSLAFFPAVAVVLAIALSTLTLRLDAAGALDAELLFAGNAEGARALLSVVAGSLITVVSVAFSVTALAIQQAATQYTPRVLRSFTSDRGNQLVLAVYVGTFTFALLVLRKVREATDTADAFVPALSITTAMVLAMVSLGALVYFFDHATRNLQVAQLVQGIRREFDAELAHVFPEAFGPASVDPETFDALLARRVASAGERRVVVRAREEGYLAEIDEAALTAAVRGARYAVCEVGIGEYVQPGRRLVELWTDHALGDAPTEALRRAFVLDRHRSIHQDLAFGLQQLVDIAVKALSPGINDPTTAEQCLDKIGGGLALLAERAMPSPVRRVDGTDVLFRVRCFGEYVALGFGQIRHAARGDAHVTAHLVGVIGALAERVDGARLAPLLAQLDAVLEGLEETTLIASEAEAVRARIVALRPWPHAADLAREDPLPT